MSREIKFRAWDKDERRYYYDAQDCYDYFHGLNASYFGDLLKNDNFEVEQYTGLKDKNGKEIYEGDIVEDYSGRRGKVYFDEGKLAYLFSDPHSWNQWWLRPEFGEYEVIGNIHENPELLEGEK